MSVTMYPVREAVATADNGSPDFQDARSRPGKCRRTADGGDQRGPRR